MSQREISEEFELLTRKHIEGLWRTALRMSGSRDRADDLLQETCLRAYRSFNEYESGTNFKAWIFRILTNLCKDNYRRESRSPIREWDDIEVKKATAENNIGFAQPDAELESRELANDTYRAMCALPMDIRVVVSLSLLGDFSYQQIAEQLDIPIGTVRSRLSRGRMQLQRTLIRYVDEESLPLHGSSRPASEKISKTNVLQIFPERANRTN